MTLLPTKTFDHVWIYTRSKNHIDALDPEYIGKWLIFRDEAKIDSAWDTIATETRDGRLGIAAKVSTQLRNPMYEQFVICVYTKDYRDEDDVYNVRQRLKELGFKKRINYKTDNATRKGVIEYRYNA